MLKSIAAACALVLTIASAAAAAEERAPAEATVTVSSPSDAPPTDVTSADAAPADATDAGVNVSDTARYDTLADHHRWVFTLIPYAWTVRLDGSAAQFGFPESPVSVGRDTLLDHFRAGFMLGGEARYDRFSIQGDVFAVRVDDLATPLPATSRVDEVIATLGGGYAFARGDNYQVDVIAGVRLWSTRNKLTFTSAAGPLAGHSLSDGDTWVDPYIGLRGEYQFTRRWYALGYVKVGGGLGSGSDSMWDVMAGVGYIFYHRTSVLAGYRNATVDYRNGAFIYDVTHQGPFVGLVVRF